jgi:tetratricopeptide (TPR) repeat protein
MTDAPHLRKMVIVQASLAVISFFIVGWVFFKERPQAEVNSQLQQKIVEVQTQNTKLQQNVVTPTDRTQSRAFLRQGVAQFHLQQYDQAVTLYDKALAVFPDDSYAWGLKGYALFRAGHIQESIDANQKAIELDPGDPLGYLDLAKSYCGAKLYDNAKSALLTEPPPDVAPDVSRYVVSDGELRRVCSPILAEISKPVSTIAASPAR